MFLQEYRQLVLAVKKSNFDLNYNDMTHESEIDKKINDEYDQLRNAKYTGVNQPPENLIELFGKALMELPHEYHKFNMVKVKQILEKNDVNELTLMELGVINNIVNKVPPKFLFKNKFHYCEHYIANVAFTEEYNAIVAEVEKKLQAKKENMKNTSGIIRNNKIIGGRGRIISANH